MSSSKSAVLSDAGTTTYLGADDLAALHLERAPTVTMAADNPPKPGQKPGDPMANTTPREPGKPAPAPQPLKGDPMACQGKCR